MLSHVLLGAPHAAGPLVECLGPRALDFVTWTQRILWGLHLPEFVRVDVDAEAARLCRRFPDHFVAHLIDAFVARSRGRAARADEALERARRLAGDAGPLHYLLPSAEEWAGLAPEQRLVEVVPGQVWRVPAYTPAPHTPFQWNSVGTLVRAESGQVVFINPVALAPGVARAVEELGRMSILATATVPHHCHVEGLRAAYPRARHLGVTGHARHPPSRHLRFDGFLDAREPLCPELDLVVLAGFDFEEGMFLHRPSGLLIGQDLVMANFASDRETPFALRLYSFGFGVHDRLGLFAYQVPLYKHLPTLRAALRQVLSWDFRGVVGCHWRCEPYRGEHVQTYRALLSWLSNLSGSQHKRLLMRFAWHQFGILRDFLRYDLSQRRAPARARPSELAGGNPAPP